MGLLLQGIYLGILIIRVVFVVNHYQKATVKDY